MQLSFFDFPKFPSQIVGAVGANPPRRLVLVFETSAQERVGIVTVGALLCSVVENSRFYAPKLKIAFLEALSNSIGDNLSILSALYRLKIDIYM